MSELAQVLQNLFPEKTWFTFWQLIDLYLEALGFYILALDSPQEAKKIGDAIMEARLSNKYWIRRLARPAIFAENGETDKTDYILYERNRIDLVFSDNGLTISPSNPLYPKIMETRQWADKISAEVNPDGSLTVWLIYDGKRVDTDYHFLADEILMRFIQLTYPERVRQIIQNGPKH